MDMNELVAVIDKLIDTEKAKAKDPNRTKSEQIVSLAKITAYQDVELIILADQVKQQVVA